MISIIVPCYNEELFLPLLFNAIEKLDTTNVSYEVIIVDNGSSDKSVVIAKNHNAVVLIKHKGNISALRNFGAKIANGSLLAFLDADCIPGSKWLEEAYKYVERPDVGIFGSIPHCPKDGTWVEKAWLATIPHGINDTGFLCTANMFIKQNVFTLVNGFNERLSTGEDYDICQRILQTGYRAIHDDKIIVVHRRYPKTLWERFKKEIWYGKEMVNILKIKPCYRPFWASLVWGLCLIVVLLSTLLMKFGLHFILCIIICLSLPVISTIIKLLEAKNYKYFFQLIILFFVYFAGRFTSILSSLRKFYAKLHKLQGI